MELLTLLALLLSTNVIICQNKMTFYSIYEHGGLYSIEEATVYYSDAISLEPV